MTVFLDVEDDVCACGASLVECPFCGKFCADACAASSGPCPHWAELVARADAARGAPA